ncbi:hypothetical protein [Nocardioides sp. zg-DK7169]|uniref:hypothetical protein n=1 Tax=Nocardioides sp. zg-DK7169 TaxID=2736600 RepID=UPI00155340E4|nr:hypothetical protein [Nocardioides sp. zg-DK7169]NPC98303.1 hypothetical protein [Nocardioides sp. zg-DK7169]
MIARLAALMGRRGAGPAADVAVGPGERVLAVALSGRGPVAATRDAIYVPAGSGAVVRVPWERVEAADWDSEAGVLRVTELGSWGLERPVHVLALEQPGRLLELVRERVTASIVFQMHVVVRDDRGLRVVARRAPSGAREIAWLVHYDDGIDPAEPAVRRVAAAALAQARAEVEPG